MRLDISWYYSFATRNGKEGIGVITLDDEICVQILRRALDQITSVIPTESHRTFKGSRSGWTSEYPVARAIGRIAESVLERCSAVDSKWKGEN
jgi:hypothetical protein